MCSPSLCLLSSVRFQNVVVTNRVSDLHLFHADPVYADPDPDPGHDCFRKSVFSREKCENETLDPDQIKNPDPGTPKMPI